eukprot:gene28219-31324_t
MRRKLFSRFQWNLSRELHMEKHIKSDGPYFSGKEPAERVLLLQHDVDLSRTENNLEMKLIVQGLIQLAILSNRTVVFPDVPCEAGWMLEQRNSSACDGSSYLKMSARELFPYAALVGFKAMLNLEYEQQWLHVDAPSGAESTPSDANTAFITAAVALKVPNARDNPSWSLGEIITTLSPQDADQELKRFDAKAILYVRHPVTVELKRIDGKAILYVGHPVTGELCRGIYRGPWDYSRGNPGVIEDAARGLAAEMQGGMIVLKPGAAFEGGARKPWKESELN